MTKKLLVIDDQAGIGRVVGRIAGELGFEAKTLTEPDKALEVFVDYRPDVVMLDMIMPEKDGIDVLNEMILTGIRSRIVLTSGLSNAFLKLAQQVAHFHERTNVAVLRKPFRRAELVSVLTEAA